MRHSSAKLRGIFNAHFWLRHRSNKIQMVMSSQGMSGKLAGTPVLRTGQEVRKIA